MNKILLGALVTLTLSTLTASARELAEEALSQETGSMESAALGKAKAVMSKGKLAIECKVKRKTLANDPVKAAKALAHCANAPHRTIKNLSSATALKMKNAEYVKKFQQAVQEYAVSHGLTAEELYEQIVTHLGNIPEGAKTLSESAE